MPNKEEPLFEPVEVMVSDDNGFAIVTTMSPIRTTLLERLLHACQHHADNVVSEW